jgi:diguanylate cyclase (GGDEF)-like protein
VALVIATSAILAGSMLAARGSQMFWLSVPAALLVAAVCPGVRSAAASSATVLGATAAPALIGSLRVQLPSPWLALLVPTASVAILLALRMRSERQHAALRATALTDPLTGVANRRALFERIEYEIARHARVRRSFALVMIDLDGFKPLNDRFGHAAGDDLLRDVASALRVTLRDQDIVGRIGGDEFCLLAPETGAGGTRALAQRATWAVGSVTAGLEALGASVGPAVFPADGRSVSQLLEAADRRLLEAKRQAQAGSRRAA